MQETPQVPSSANVQQQQQVTQQQNLAQTIDLDSEIFDQTKHTSTTPKPILNNKTNQPVQSVAQPFSYNATGKKPLVPYKDSIGDLDDMINDFEKKYSTNKAPDNNNNIRNSNVNLNANNASKTSVGGANSTNSNNMMNANNNSTRPVLKTPVHMQGKKNPTANIKETLLAQFKEDPVFGDLLQGSNNNNSGAGGNKIPTANLNISNTNLQQGNRRNSNLTSAGNSNLDANSKIDSNLQKKKFDDFFNNFDSNNTNKTSNPKRK
jgi:hypothetical protein